MSDYYKTGELAKIANVSVRTIRYYDRIGLLKPSLIKDNGYRYYSEGDAAKLQQILSLKYLGFSLDDIMAMSLNDDPDLMRTSLKLQRSLIDRRLEHLTSVRASLDEALTLMESHQHIDWAGLLHVVNMSTLDESLITQYKNATNVDIRIRLHEKYATNPTPWFVWLFDHYALTEASHVLEIGCGTGELWRENAGRIPEGTKILLTDVSGGMINDAKERLHDLTQMSFAVMNAEQLNVPDASQDVVIANHVMFYVHDIPKALKEIRRVLKPGGKAYISTYGSDHMKEITELSQAFDKRISLSQVALYDNFGLANGGNLLKDVFDDVRLERYDDALEVTDTDDLANYILSCHGNQTTYISGHYDAFRALLEGKMAEKGAIHITKDAGVFVCMTS